MTTSPIAAPPARFAATRWSIVLAAGNWQHNDPARRAMNELAQIYWFPLYAYLRRRGYSPAQSEDLVQGFFAHVLEKNALAAVDQSRGSFRSFLLASLNHFLANEHDKTTTLKRGGQHKILSLNTPESRYAANPVDTLTPEHVFERRWALTVLDQVLQRLREDYTQRGQIELFTTLEHLLTGHPGDHYRTLANRLAMTESAIKVAAHRLRRRYRQLLQSEIAQTLSDPAQVQEEIQHLLASL